MDWRSPLSKFASCALAAATLTLLVAPSARAWFFDYDLNPDAADYESCAAGLVGEGIAPEEAARACGIALKPDALAECVTDVDRQSLAATEVLDACRRVRRPDELASCFNDIRNADGASTPENVLSNCRRSLLPSRFASCVIGLRREITFSTDAAMASCIAAGDRPRNVLPNFRPTNTP